MNAHQEPQACVKCRCMPEDILMLACSHDLCLNCAAERLAFEMKKNKNTNVIVCQECHQKTPLDAESINVLKGLAKPSISQVKPYEQNAGVSSKYQDPSAYDRSLRNQPAQRNVDKYSYDRANSLGANNQTDRQNYNNRSDRHSLTNNTNNVAKSKVVPNDAFQGISSKKTCTEHHEEQILYFCFDCKCQCICPECVIHGKHKDHDVKTIRKSQPLIKSQVDKYIDQFNNNVETLLIKKSEIEKQIRSLTEQNNVSKKQIQQAFQDLRNKIGLQEKELLSRCDANLSDNLTELQKSSKQVGKRIDELKTSTATMSEATRKDQILFLNFYSRKHKQMQEDARDPEVSIPSTELSSNQSVLSSILDVSDQVTRLGSPTRPAARRDN